MAGGKITTRPRRAVDTECQTWTVDRKRHLRNRRSGTLFIGPLNPATPTIAIVQRLVAQLPWVMSCHCSSEARPHRGPAMRRRSSPRGRNPTLPSQRRSAAIISSLISTGRAPTRRRTLVVSGKMPTTSVRRLSSRFNRAMGLFDQILDWDDVWFAYFADVVAANRPAAQGFTRSR